MKSKCPIPAGARFVLLEGILPDINRGHRFFSPNTSDDPTTMADGVVAYKIIGHAETVAEAQQALYGRTFS